MELVGTTEAAYLLGILTNQNLLLFHRATIFLSHSL